MYTVTNMGAIHLSIFLVLLLVNCEGTGNRLILLYELNTAKHVRQPVDVSRGTSSI